ncbi:hypothetical protein BT63DRAFT_483188 [Microthyrium microscopicum]|uniref:MHD domain-containing protein n=1 Tax=Microthyrium microscopicum TaxID=703497 RepID=A0A6A6TZQ5_9PEZI|nr:hypothetical protein BT63DRAFT_483188 [Microthyrium microscopicum]
MDLQRQEYPSMLKSLQPTQAVTLLNGRLNHIRAINSDVAEWLLERRRIEEQYAISLRKLSKKPLSQDQLDLGIFTTPWQKIVESTETLANSHHTFARNIEGEVEKPLRNFPQTSREMANMENIQGNIGALARDFDNANKKVEKLNQKGGKAPADKVASAATEVEDSKSSWDSQAPYVFEKLQEVDEMRLELLQKCLTQFLTFTDETKNSSSASVEQCLNSLLNVQVSDEIQHFSMKAPGSIPAVRERRMSRPQAPPSFAETSSLAPPSIPADAASMRSDSFQDIPTPMQEKRQSKFGGGLKRLGTVIKGRRNSTHPYSQPLQSPEKKRSSTNIASKFSSFGKRTKDTPDALSPQATGNSRRSDGQGSTTPRPSDLDPPSLDRAISSHSNAPPIESPSEFAPVLPVIASSAPLTNGNHTPVQREVEQLQPPLEPTTSVPANIPAPVIEEPEPEPAPLSGPDAITQAMNEAAMLNPDGSQAQFKVDIKNAPIQEEDGDATAALASVANALRSQATPRRNPTLRGRRDRNTIIVPSPSVPELPTVSALASTSASSLPTSPNPNTQSPTPPLAATPFKLAHRSTLGTDDGAASDTHSIRSGRSLSSTMSNTVRHPDMHSPGLNASIVETVSAWFVGGECTKAVEIGEVALVFNSHDSAEPSGTETIRFDHFNTLEKVAPNPVFIDPVANKDGNYTVNLSHIARTSVAFKYQVHLDASSASTSAPLRLIPAWKVGAEQTLLMLTYSLNPSFTPKIASGVSAVHLTNVVLIAHLDPGAGKISRCQAQGGGVYDRQRNIVYWRLNEITLTKDAPAQALRARFFTEGEAKPGHAEARWELAGEQLAMMGSGIGLSRMDAVTPKPAVEGEEADPFADADAEESGVPTPTVSWTDVATVRKLRSGTYSAEAAPVSP